MNLRKLTMLGSLTAFAAGGAMLAPPQAWAAEEGMEELTRGPVHEAFAASVSFDPEPGIYVKSAPPELIEEVPPDQRPEGDNVAWIPGYWGWDDDQSEFIWISGVWRNLPPGRQWVPGYWGEAENQWQWTSGYWADEEAEEVTYVSKPPKSIESGPNIEAPSKDHVWVSGTWINREDRYAWRPGYWEAGQENWSMTPAHYTYTPRGYVFVDSYWDYNVARRGVVFAPVRFQPAYYSRPNYSYTPSVVISLGVFSDHLFVRPNYGHYYYGDYYEPRYQQQGFFASFSYSSSHRGYDPIYAHSRWEHRDDRDWERGRRDNFDYYRSNQDARPPRTWAALQSRPEEGRRGKRDNYQFAETLPQYANRSKNQRFEPVTAERRKEIVTRNQQVRKFSQERRQMENRPNDRATEGSDKRIQAKREKFQKSPVVGKRAAQMAANEAPPKRREQRNVEARDGKNADQPNNADRPNRPNRDGEAQSENGKAKDRNPDQPRGNNNNDGGNKNEPGDKPNGKNGDRPNQQDGPNMKDNNQDNKARPDRNPDGNQPNKPDSTPNRADNRPDATKKQAAEQDNTPKKQQREEQSDKPKRQAQPQQDQPKRQQAEPDNAPKKQQREAQSDSPKRQAQPQQDQPKRQQAEPQRQAPPKQKAAPEQKRQAQPQQDQPKRQKAQPEPQRQAAPEAKRQAQPQQQQQRQAKPDRQQAPNKKASQEEDPDAKKKN